MPYTLSHAVVSLPLSLLCREKVPLAAIMVGSISPDLPYLLALTPTAAPGHSLSGVLIYCLMPALLMLLIWYRWLEKPNLDLFYLPRRTGCLGWRSWLSIIVGVLLGAYSHVLWDATSHAQGVFVKDSPFWQQELLALPLYKWNQYGSGILGLLVLFIWYLRVTLKRCRQPYQGRFVSGVLIYGISIFSMIVLANLLHTPAQWSAFFSRAALGGIDGILLGMCCYAFWVSFKSEPEQA